MSTTKKGDLFEGIVYEIFRNYINQGQGILNPRSCKFFRKKGYFSRDRNSQIVVDISIEAFQRGATEWHLLTVLECKDLTRSVPVDDIEEFNSKLSQIAGRNVKGIVVSRGAFQSGAIEYARAKGIALVRVLPEDQIEWTLQRSGDSIPVDKQRNFVAQQVKLALTDAEHVGICENIFGSVNDALSSSLSSILSELYSDIETQNFVDSDCKRLLGSVRSSAKVPYIGKEEIEDRAQGLRDFFGIDRLYNVNGYLKFDEIISYLSDEHEVKFSLSEGLGENADGDQILGRWIPERAHIAISELLEKDSPRWRFTLGHEIGHLLMHRGLDLPSFYGGHMDTEAGMWPPRSVLRRFGDFERLEWQANQFASAILMPRDDVVREVVRYLDRSEVRRFHKGVIFLDDQVDNQIFYEELSASLSRKYRVSKRVVYYRLKHLMLLNDNRAVRKIREYIPGVFD